MPFDQYQLHRRGTAEIGGIRRTETRGCWEEDLLLQIKMIPPHQSCTAILETAVYDVLGTRPFLQSRADAVRALLADFSQAPLARTASLWILTTAPRCAGGGWTSPCSRGFSQCEIPPWYHLPSAVWKSIRFWGKGGLYATRIPRKLSLIHIFFLFLQHYL